MAPLRLGAAADFLSTPALLGFMNGAAFVIISSQIGKFFGISLTQDNTLLRLWEWGSQLGNVHTSTVLTGLASVAVLVLCRWLLRKIPGPVVVFVLAVVAGRCFDFSRLGMQLIV
jgi:sulfate permease, SulP family